jgi:dihydrodipicolinate synthase/N-acetylneuraminate lyase
MAMPANELKERLRGVIAYAITPFQSNLSLDLAGLNHNLSFLLASGVHASGSGGGVQHLHGLRDGPLCGSGRRSRPLRQDHAKGGGPPRLHHVSLAAYDAARRRDSAELRRPIRERVAPIHDLRDKPSCSAPAIKEAMNLLGMPAGRKAEPSKSPSGG